VSARRQPSERRRNGDEFLGEDCGKCPCGQPIGIAYDADDKQPIGMTHGLPQCPDFEKREVDDYLAWVNDMRMAAAMPVVSE